MTLSEAFATVKCWVPVTRIVSHLPTEYLFFQRKKPQQQQKTTTEMVSGGVVFLWVENMAKQNH